MEIYYMYQKQRKEFGRHAKFSDSPAEVLVDLRPEPALAENHMERNPCVTNVQVVPEMSEHEVNTERFSFGSQGMLHTEGGWPKDVDPQELEHTIRYRKKVEKDEDYIRAIKVLGDKVDTLLKQNNAIDIYEEYFSGSVADHSSEQPYAKTLTVFREPTQRIRRAASYISWYPDGARKLAVAYSILQFQQMPEDMPTSSYIWDISNPNTPETELTPTSQACCLVYNPKDPNVLAAGLYNGQVSYFDTRKGSAPVDSSPIERSHSDPVYDVVWLTSKTGTECASVSTDGSVMWWDTRRLGEPVESLVLQEKGSNVILGGVSMEYEAAGGAGKFMVGTEEGIVLACNRKAKLATDRVTASYQGHHGPVCALERSPFYPKYFLSAGDWTARIWNEDLRTAIMTTRYHSSYITGATWSPTRPGVFFTSKKDGSLDVWDYFYKQNDPTLTVKVMDEGIGLTSFRVQESGKMLAAGASDGSTTLLDFCEGLAVMQPNEKQSIAQMLERETKREKNLETRAKELKIKAKKDQAKTETVTEAESVDDVLKRGR
ncbi:Cytoplasmic dynein intermediate chain [Klebsormidium nitens]|uniref:Cytoplasmic dynein intermediate chain n=1 Tax=Klebsormidium nitens TaxID=105231 RepID=A0A0U9HLA8_KLENI|nr:Cytoplasmic dynein intermediate chain [Klebsormidium nitens]|eukprot:GAQ88949.1 Cytoplasmic dynein intermediate chain [Klebsormidium nitens]